VKAAVQVESSSVLRCAALAGKLRLKVKVLLAPVTQVPLLPLSEMFVEGRAESGPEYTVGLVVFRPLIVSDRSPQSVLSRLEFQLVSSPVTTADARERPKVEDSLPVLVIVTVPTALGPQPGSI
jgi:hypothetical protein